MSGARDRTAFTLVELLVSLAILATVSLSTMLVFRGVTRAWRTGELRSARYQQARLLFDLFSRELSSCVANPRYPLIGTETSAGASLQPESRSDELFFVGTIPGRSGFVERGYWVNAQSELMCHDGEPADGSYATGTSELCGQTIAQFDATYFDGTAWRDQWEAHPEGALPKAIHIILAIGPQDPERFETVIYVPTS